MKFFLLALCLVASVSSFIVIDAVTHPRPNRYQRPDLYVPNEFGDFVPVYICHQNREPKCTNVFRDEVDSHGRVKRFWYMPAGSEITPEGEYEPYEPYEPSEPYRK